MKKLINDALILTMIILLMGLSFSIADLIYNQSNFDETETIAHSEHRLYDHNGVCFRVDFIEYDTKISYHWARYYEVKTETEFHCRFHLQNTEVIRGLKIYHYVPDYLLSNGPF